MLGVEIPIKNKWEFSCNSREAVEGRNGNSGVLFGGPRAAGASAGSDEVQQEIRDTGGLGTWLTEPRANSTADNRARSVSRADSATIPLPLSAYPPAKIAS
jgi:hypothetical protein